MGCTQGKRPGETVPDYGCSGAAVARVNAAFIGRVQASPSSSASEGATRTGLPLRTYWASAYGHQGAMRRSRLGHPLLPLRLGGVAWACLRQ